MIEMLGVLAIIGVLSVGGIAGYTKAMAKYKVNKTIDQITQIAMNIKTLYANQKDYSGMTPEILIKAKAIPDVTVKCLSSDYSNCYFLDVWGGEINISQNGDKFYIWLQEVPVDACIEIMTQDWFSRFGDSLKSFGVSGLMGDASDSVINFSRNPTVSEATEQCSLEDEYHTPIGLTFTFK